MIGAGPASSGLPIHPVWASPASLTGLIPESPGITRPRHQPSRRRAPGSGIAPVMSEPLLERLTAEERRLAVPAPAPTHAEVMKAVLERQSFSDPAWIFERKLDGIRCLAIREHDEVRMLSRNDLDLGGRYPAVREAIAGQAHRRFAIDGEIVAFEGSQTSFAKLTQRGRESVPVFFYVF